ncbi:MAG: hypothetical protein HZA08_07370 [Nitrospirae bacterium]|nr:hypothetical protein [Nitrospirota bacterium]
MKIENKSNIVALPVCDCCQKISLVTLTNENVNDKDAYCEECFHTFGSLKQNHEGVCPVCRLVKPYHEERCLLLVLSNYYSRHHEVIVHEDLWIEAGRLRLATVSEGKVSRGLFPDVTHILPKGSRIKVIIEEGLR